MNGRNPKLRFNLKSRFLIALALTVPTRAR